MEDESVVVALPTMPVMLVVSVLTVLPPPPLPRPRRVGDDDFPTAADAATGDGTDEGAEDFTMVYFRLGAVNVLVNNA